MIWILPLVTERPAAHDLTRFFADPGFRGAPANRMFGRLATEAPVLPVGTQWVLSSRRAIARASRDGTLSMSRATFPAEARAANVGFVEFFENNLFFKPVAEHDRLKALLAAHFVPATVAALREPLDRIARDLLGAAVADHPDRVDLVADLAARMPALVAALVIGVPETDRSWLAGQADGLLTELRQSFPSAGVDPGRPLGAEGFAELRSYVTGLLDGPVPADSLAARLVAARGAGALGTADAVDLILLLLMAGVDTVVTGMTNAMAVLLDRPAELARIAAGVLDPGAAFSEALRLFTPVPFARRRVDAAVTVDGVRLEPGQEVLLCLAAGNRDPAVFDAPDGWRPERGPGGTLSFGHGVYHCVGAALGRLEGAAVLAALAGLGPVASIDEPVGWNDNIGFHSPAVLPVTPRDLRS